jgi:hypothetical protein
MTFIKWRAALRRNWWVILFPFFNFEIFLGLFLGFLRKATLATLLLSKTTSVG